MYNICNANNHRNVPVLKVSPTKVCQVATCTPIKSVQACNQNWRCAVLVFNNNFLLLHRPRIHCLVKNYFSSQKFMKRSNLKLEFFPKNEMADTYKHKYSSIQHNKFFKCFNYTNDKLRSMFIIVPN